MIDKVINIKDGKLKKFRCNTCKDQGWVYTYSTAVHRLMKPIGAEPCPDKDDTIKHPNG